MTEVVKRRSRSKKKQLDLVESGPGVVEYVDESDLPELTVLPEFLCVGLIRFPNNTYSQATVTISSGKITNIELDTPNVRSVAIDALKIACMKKVIDAVNF